MAIFPARDTSYWSETTPRRDYGSPSGDLKADVLVVGGGIAGLTTAYLLKQRGKRVAVLEKARLGDSVSGFTTGKITSQHNLTYTSLIKNFGETHARIYGEANETAIRQIEKIITAEGIDCDWRREDNYVYTEKQGERAKLQREADDAGRLGLPATFQTTTPLPFEVAAAVRFSNQATFHIGKYLQGLAAAIDGNGSYVFEHTKASHIKDGAAPHLRVPGATLWADNIVIATNVPTPVVMHAAYAFLEYPARSYIVAGALDRYLPGMYINTGHPSRSILPYRSGDVNYLLIGGEGHFVGLSGPRTGKYEALADYAKTRFDVEANYRWTAWDYVAYDNLPLVGKAYPFSKHVFVATGFRKWGLTNATAAAMILTDELTGTANPWAHTFRSTRLSAVTSLPKGTAQGIISSF